MRGSAAEASVLDTLSQRWVQKGVAILALRCQFTEDERVSNHIVDGMATNSESD